MWSVHTEHCELLSGHVLKLIDKQPLDVSDFGLTVLPKYVAKTYC